MKFQIYNNYFSNYLFVYLSKYDILRIKVKLFD